MKRISAVAIAVGASFAFAQPALATNLLTNGSFEGTATNYTLLSGGSAAISGWTTTNQGVEWFKPAAYGGAAYDGSAAIDLAWYTSNGTPGGGIAQSFSTVVGQAYEITFYGVTHAVNGRNGTGIIELSVDGGSLNAFNLTNLAATFGQDDWQKFSHSFVATGTSTTIEFRNRQNALQHFAYLDDVSVTAIPEPASWIMMLGGIGILGVALRRKTSISFA